jgi:hypothetical protein
MRQPFGSRSTMVYHCYALRGISDGCEVWLLEKARDIPCAFRNPACTVHPWRRTGKNAYTFKFTAHQQCRCHVIPDGRVNEKIQPLHTRVVHNSSQKHNIFLHCSTLFKKLREAPGIVMALQIFCRHAEIDHILLRKMVAYPMQHILRKSMETRHH